MKRIILIFAFLSVLAVSQLMGQRVHYILSQGTNMSAQKFIPMSYDSVFAEDALRRVWDMDEHIVAAGFTYHGLQIVTSKYPGWGNQRYEFSHEYPKQFVEDMNAKGYTITELSTDGANWLAIATEVEEAPTQTFFEFDDPTTPEGRAEMDNVIKQMADEGAFITDVACGGNTWYAVATYDPDIVGQIYDFPVAAQDFSDFFMRNQTQGYRISASDYGPGHYFCVMTKTKSRPKAQALLPGVEDPNSVMETFWKQQFAITKVGH
ncbi:MAG: hypothetical protein NC338_03480 [Firmicutes bacterium]|nr:hypothetical protein [Bacillota bacterium]MCM1401297.1 hypothetical protein [Bacteroides sp.]MCM1476748.1 hypothetical protein [Bacteroides sp.]